jgi:hypothetical protein
LENSGYLVGREHNRYAGLFFIVENIRLNIVGLYCMTYSFALFVVLNNLGKQRPGIQAELGVSKVASALQEPHAISKDRDV